MSDFSVVLNEDVFSFTDLSAWRDVEHSFKTKTVSHCWAVTAPLVWHSAVLKAMSRMYLCDAGRGDDDCGGCAGWSKKDSTKESKEGPKEEFCHPDLIVAGEFEKAPNIEACRTLIKELPLKPVLSRRRLGVVLAADKLLTHAANSLLKLAEEPPSHACLLFLLEGNDFLPTLRSRSRFTTLAAPFSLTAKPMPADEAEWLEWIDNLKNTKDDTNIPKLLSAWVSHAMRSGELLLAARIEKLRLIIEQKRLSQNMVCDLLTLTLKEELPFEHIFGGIR